MTTRTDSRSLDETFHWIKTQVDDSSGAIYDVHYPQKDYSWHHVNEYDSLRLKNCQLVFDQKYHNNSRPTMSLEYTIPLWDLASATYELDNGSKQFKYTPGVRSLYLRSRTKSMHWTKPRSYFPTDLVQIQFGRDPNFGSGKINQLGQAFLHLRDLCSSYATKGSPVQQSVTSTPTPKAPD